MGMVINFLQIVNSVTVRYLCYARQATDPQDFM